MTSETAQRFSQLAQEWVRLVDRLFEIKKEASKSLPLFVAMIAADEKEPRTLNEFIKLIAEAGYVTEAKDFPYMVYQVIQALVEHGVLQKGRQNRNNTYCFVGNAVSP